VIDVGDSKAGLMYAIAVPNGNAHPWHVEPFHLGHDMCTDLFELFVFDGLQNT
jgi:hypothetical protein